ncbi:anti-sigma regulatory factor [Sphaerotilus mobilis]|uniref:Serine/threonine-protein kinase RsbT n=1 Tax=Sphaerotilus mobilis TaxID=47994 RepID=A0A4Q7LRY0_9BURK|nr:anti-sigma regulatory factor [Sphaerotilus mobilis]RZS57163.1 serine/threonine-protein kinase RsbT [Sphaerotilus mobilis]
MLELQASDDIVRARLAARDMARAAGLGVMDQTRFATAVSELGRNAVRYAVQGRCELSDQSDARAVRLQACVRDSGPGISDLALALQDGYSTGGSMGAGLPGTQRLVDIFEIESSPAGTVVTVQIVRPRRNPGRVA